MSVSSLDTGVSPFIVLLACQRVISGRNFNFSKTFWISPHSLASKYKRKKYKTAVFRGHSPLREHRLFIGADGTDVPSLLTQQARAIPPLLELCAPSHGNNDVVTSGASPIHNLKVKIAISAVLYRQQIRKLKNGVVA